MTDPSASLKVRPDAARAMEEARHEAVSIRHALDTIELEEALEGRDVVKDFRRHAEVIEGLLRAFTQRDARLAAIVQEMRNRASDKWEIGEALRNDLLRWVDQLAALGADEEGK